VLRRRGIRGSLNLLGNTYHAIRVHLLTSDTPRLPPTLSRPHVVERHFTRCDQLTVGLASAGVRPGSARPK
jgi:hypothetical protein